MNLIDIKCSKQLLEEYPCLIYTAEGKKNPDIRQEELKFTDSCQVMIFNFRFCHYEHKLNQEKYPVLKLITTRKLIISS